MTKWRNLDLWSDDHPDVQRLRDGLRLAPPTAPAPQESIEQAFDDPGPSQAPSGPSRRQAVARLVERIQRGDLSAVDQLRRLLDDPGS